MHDMPSVMLLQQGHAIPKTGEELEVLGKCAAKMYIEGDSESLNDAVVETVKHAGLSPEQVKRVIEFANTDAYLTEFNKEGAHHKYVEFHGGPADPGEVLRDLNDGGGGTIFDRGLSDYSREPEAPKTASIMEKNLSVVHDALQAHAGLEKVARTIRMGVDPSMMDIGRDMQGDAMKAYSLPGYGGGSMGFDPFGERQKMMQVKMMSAMTGRRPVVVKHASLDFNPSETALRDAFAVEEEQYPYAEPLQDSYAMRDKLAGAAEHLTAEVFGLENQLNERLEDVYQEVKTACLQDELELGQILAAWQQVVPDSLYVKVAFEHIGPRLAEEEVFRGLDGVGASLEKTAHVGMLNTNHPLVGSMSAFCTTLDKLAETRAAQEELLQGRDELDEFIRKMADAKAGLVKNIVQAAKRGGEAAGRGGKQLGETIFGQGSHAAEQMGNIARGAVTYSPHMAAGAGGLVAAQELSENPYTRAVWSRVPGTQANTLRHQRALAMSNMGGYGGMGGMY